MSPGGPRGASNGARLGKFEGQERKCLPIGSVLLSELWKSSEISRKSSQAGGQSLSNRQVIWLDFFSLSLSLSLSLYLSFYIYIHPKIYIYIYGDGKFSMDLRNLLTKNWCILPKHTVIQGFVGFVFEENQAYRRGIARGLAPSSRASLFFA